MSKEPNRNVYVGHRYVPLILEEWDNKISYEGLSVVTHKGASYTSKKRVPVGIDILNKEFWSLTGNYNAQVEYYRDETERVAEDLLLKADKSYTDTELGKKANKTYVDTELGKKADQSYTDTELGKKADKSYTDTELGKKSDKTYVDTELGKKYDKTVIDEKLNEHMYLITPDLNTEQINNILENYNDVKFLKGDYTIDSTTGILPQSNQNIKFEDGAILRATPTVLDNFQILNIRKAEKLNIKGNLTIIGERYDHLTSTGQGGHGVFISESKDVQIENILSVDNWGDGFYIGSGLYPSERIHLINCYAKNNRRNNMSITNGNDLTFDNCKFENANGQTPEFGIDIEPNFSSDELQNIVFNNCETIDNAVAGFGLARITQDKPVTITLNNCKSTGDTFQVRDCWGIGLINVNNYTNIDSQRAAIILERSDIPIKMNNPYVLNPNQLSLESEQYGSGIHVVNTENVKDMMGNIDIINAEVNSYDDKMTKAVTVNAGGGWTAMVENVYISYKTNVEPLKRLSYGYNTMGYNNKIVFTDDKKAFFNNPINTNILPETLEDYKFMTLSNKGTSTSTSVDLNSRTLETDGLQFTFINKEDHYFLILGNILGYEERIGNRVKGSRITLEWNSELNGWAIINSVGDWTPPVSEG